MSITGKLHTYPSPNPTLTLTCYQLATPRATLTHLSCSPNFSRASYLDERTDDVWNNCFITFSTRWKIFFPRNLFADVTSVHNRNMKHLAQLNLIRQIYKLCYNNSFNNGVWRSLTLLDSRMPGVVIYGTND